MNFLINIIFSISFLFLPNRNTDQQEILQTVLDIEEFQHYAIYSPRFESTTKYNYGPIYLLSFGDMDIQANYRFKNKDIIVINDENIEAKKADYFIKIDEFKIEKKEAKILLSYKSPRLISQKGKKILLDASLIKDNSGLWIVDRYQVFQVNISD